MDLGDDQARGGALPVVLDHQRGNAPVGVGAVAGHRRHHHPVGEREAAQIDRREQVEVHADLQR
nr:hypothetical protein [Streptomyces hydrogenans]